MSTLHDEFRSGINEMFAAAGETATIDGNNVPVISDGVAYEEVFDRAGGGFTPLPVLTLTIAAGRNHPVIGTKVTYQNKRYKILSFSEDIISYTIKCGSIDA